MFASEILERVQTTFEPFKAVSSFIAIKHEVLSVDNQNQNHNIYIIQGRILLMLHIKIYGDSMD